jgi:hypothetical protein
MVTPYDMATPTDDLDGFENLLGMDPKAFDALV